MTATHPELTPEELRRALEQAALKAWFSADRYTLETLIPGAEETGDDVIEAVKAITGKDVREAREPEPGQTQLINSASWCRAQLKRWAAKQDAMDEVTERELLGRDEEG